MQLPVAPGMWPAFWGLGTDLNTVNWPNCGEIDVMENIGYSDWISGALHGPGYFGAGSVGGRINMPSTVGNFHEYRVDWDPTYVQWYVDGVLLLTANRSDVVATRGQWVYDHDFFLILNLAMGGDYPAGYNGATTPFFGLPQATVDMLPLRVNVDYVRVYQKQ
jgi:beta-glucanase (GH16 family)